MEWTEILMQIFELCIIPLLGVLTTFVIIWIKKKTNEVKATTDNEMLHTYLEVLEKTVINAVVATNQTYVDSLKGQNAFDAEAQKKAFEQTYNAVMKSLTEDMKAGLQTITTDLSTYVTDLIEAKIKEKKKG